MNKQELIDRFKKLGAKEPEAWAESQLEHGINQLARYTFLKGAWDFVVAEDHEWIDRELSEDRGEDKPFSGLPKALKNILDAGAKKEDITELVRCMQVEMMTYLMYMLQDPGIVEGNEDIDWALIEFDENGEALDMLEGLHETVLALDPTGRQMKPKK